MKLFFSKGSCSLVIRILIHELGLNCQFEAVDLKTKKTASNQDYYKINPKGAVPALLTNDNEILTENCVIQQYLADTTLDQTLLPLLTDFNRYRVLEWMNYITTELHKSFGPLFNDKTPKEYKDNMLVPLLLSKFKFINAALKDQDYLMGKNLTLPDAYLYVMLRWAHHFKLNLTDFPACLHFYNHMNKRKSVMTALQEENLTA